MTNFEGVIKVDAKNHWFYAEHMPFLGTPEEAQAYGQKFGIGVEIMPQESSDGDREHTICRFFGHRDSLILLLSDFFGEEDAR